MAAYFCCLRCPWTGTGLTATKLPSQDVPGVKLDANNMGKDVVIVKRGRRICGTGAALANVPIVQDKAYFEVKIQSSGTWGVGLATKKTNLNTLPLGDTADSWVLRQDGSLIHNKEQAGKLKEDLQEGDIIGVSYNHVELNFYVNGAAVNTPIIGIKGTVHPVFYVDEGAILDVQFTSFYHTPPEGFDRILIEKSLL